MAALDGSVKSKVSNASEALGAGMGISVGWLKLCRGGKRSGDGIKDIMMAKESVQKSRIEHTGLGVTQQNLP